MGRCPSLHSPQSTRIALSIPTRLIPTRRRILGRRPIRRTRAPNSGHEQQRTADHGGRPHRPGPRPWQPGVAPALVGVIAVGLAVGVAELLAAFGGWIGVFNAPASPLTSLGQSFIQLTPEWLKEFAIQTFGQNDKTALTIGMGVTLTGGGGDRDRRAAEPESRCRDHRRADRGRRGGDPDPHREQLGRPDPATGRRCRGGLFLVTMFRRQVDDPAGSTAPSAAQDEDQSLLAVQSKGAGDQEIRSRDIRCGASDVVSPCRPAAARDARRHGVDRRQFFRLAAIGAAAAAVAGALARWIPSTADVTASRRAVSLPTPTDVQEVGDVALRVPASPRSSPTTLTSTGWTPPSWCPASPPTSGNCGCTAWWTTRSR